MDGTYVLECFSQGSLYDLFSTFRDEEWYENQLHKLLENLTISCMFQKWMYDEATVFLIEDSTENLDDKLVKLEFSEPGGELSKELAKKKKKKKKKLPYRW